MKQNLFFLLLFIFIYSCSNDSDEAPFDVNNYIETSPIALDNANVKFAKDIPYDKYDKNKFDIFMPQSNTPTGLAIYIHGGGFLTGSKSKLYEDNTYTPIINKLLSNNIAFASINYRLLSAFGESEGVIKCMNDCKLALQFIRSVAEELNIDKENIILTGASAGAGTSLWIATKDDMKSSSSSNSVLKQSTRVKGVALIETQCSYDIEDSWMNEVFKDYNLTWEVFIAPFEEILYGFYGVKSKTEYESSTIDTYRKNVNMLNQITSDDPEIWANNTLTDVKAPTSLSVIYHHAYHVRAIKEKADKAGVDNVCYYGKDPILYSDPSNESFEDFIIRKIKE